MEMWKSLSFIGDCGINYEISNLGQVRNATTKKILKPWVKSNGYHQVTLAFKGKKPKYYIHRLVAIAFISNLDNKPEVNHFNGKKSDNSVTNLEWSTHKENMSHMYATGLKNQTGEKNTQAVLTEEAVRKIRQLHQDGMKQYAIADMFGVCKQSINSIVNGKTWKHVV